MANRRKPISFDTTLRNPERIAGFVSILSDFKGKILNSETALALEGEIIRKKLFVPSKKTLGTYVREYHGKFSFKADDQTAEGPSKVSQYFQEWKVSKPGTAPQKHIAYLLINTTTYHKEPRFAGGWESRLHTQYNFINELGFAKVVKGEKIDISPTGRLIATQYESGLPKSATTNESFEQSAFLNAFARYQINNPYRKNTIKVNFFYLVLSVIKYLNTNYKQPGISREDLPFIIAWGSNDFETLAEYIHSFHKKFGYRASSETVYNHAMNLLDDSTNRFILKKASNEFIHAKERDYKFSKLMVETPDEVIRKLRLTMLVSLRGAGRFIDINHNEQEKVDFILQNYAKNIEFSDDSTFYFKFMGAVEPKLVFSSDTLETEGELNAKTKALKTWAREKDWLFLKQEMKICVDGKVPSKDPVLKYIKETARLEFLSAVTIQKALPGLRVVANYKADDQGIPFGTASGGVKNKSGADIDVFEGSIHAIVEPTVGLSRSFQVEHELPSIRHHVKASHDEDLEQHSEYNTWYALFIASNISRDVGDQVALIKGCNKIEIYPWDIEDFVDFSSSGVSTVKDYRIIRPYAKLQTLTNPSG